MKRTIFLLLGISALCCAALPAYLYLREPLPQREEPRPIVTFAPSPTLELFLNSKEVKITVAPELLPAPVVVSPTALPAIIEKLSKFDITTGDKNTPLLHYQFVGEAPKRGVDPIPTIIKR